MKSVAARLLAVAVLLAGAVAVEMRQAAVERQDPLGRELLFLPTREALDLASLGNEQLTADILYMWAIQYYSVYGSGERFLYLDVMFNLITDLDPLYDDAYRLGGMLLTMAAAQAQGERDSAAVEALYDKGVAAMPDDYALAEVAAWDFYTMWKDVPTATRFLEIARQRPGAPARVARVLGRWRDKSHLWSFAESIAYWNEAIAEATAPVDLRYARSHLYDVVVERDRSELEPILATWLALRGSCPASWQEPVAAGILDAPPTDLVGREYGIDPSWCTLVADKRIRG